MKKKKIFDCITFAVGYLFFGGWAILGSIFYIRACIEFLMK